MKKILAFSDVHIGDWKNQVKYNDFGISDRLKLYVHLAEDIKKIANERNIDYIIIAGDIVQNSTITPEVANVVSIFLETLSSTNSKLIITVGQHDLSIKDESFHDWHSIITPFVPKKDNVFYFVNEGFIELDGISFHISPWTIPTFSKFRKADIFIGHGIVAGCTNVYDKNFTYSSGFKKSDLFENYQLSIIGDIHHKQVHTDKSGVIIQPGNLHCNTFKDDPEAGMFYIEYSDKVDFLEFIPNTEFEQSEKYYTFRKVHELSSFNEKRPFTFEELVQEKQKVVIRENKSPSYNINLYDHFVSMAEKAGVECLIPAFKGAYERVKLVGNTNVSPQQSKLKSLNVKNFMSIKDLQYNFNDVNELLVLGENGTGKSSLFESVFFCLTGKNTKKIDFKDLYFWGTTGFSISLEIDVNDQSIIVTRSRDNNISNLTLSIDGVTHRKSSIAETQAYLYDILGVTEQELLMFSYFSARNYKSFPSLTDSEKYSIISKFSDTEKLDYIRKEIAEEAAKTKTELSSVTFYLEQLNNELEKINSNISRLDVIEPSIDIDSILKKASTLENKANELRDRNEDLKNESHRQNNTQERYKYLKTNFEMQKQEYLKNIDKIKKLSSHVCFECGQHYCSEDVDTKINNFNIRNKELAILTKQNYAEIKLLEEEISTFIKIDYQEIINNSSLISKIEHQLSEFKKLISRSSKISDNSTKKSTYEESLRDVSLKISEFSNKSEEISKNLTKYKNLVKFLSKDGAFSTSLLKITCENFNSELDDLLLSSGYSARISSDSELSVLVSVNGNLEVGFDSLSSGQQKIIEVAFIVALINRYCSTYSLFKGILGYVFLDEIFSYLDSSRLSLAKSILDKCKANKIIITHEADLKHLFEHKLLVSLNDDASSNYLEIL